MQSLNLVDYIKVYNIISNTDLKNILAPLQSDNSIWKKHAWTDRTNNEIIRKSSDEMYVTTGKVPEHNNFIMSKIYEALSNYFSELDTPKEFNSWQGYTPVRFNRYDKNQAIITHVDKITSIFDGTRKGSPICSIVGLLNDDFTGGEFIMFDDFKISLKAGDIMIFPSLFMYPHKVNKVETGARYTFVSWAW